MIALSKSCCGKLSSDSFTQEEGVPQGAILSTTLFNVKLNGIAKELPTDVHCSLYVDDFVIFYRSSTSMGIGRRIQLSIDKVVKWTLKNGFTVSPDKTKAMHFCNCSKHYEGGYCFNPQIKLGDVDIKYESHHKFLGLYWDPRLTFKEHVNYLKKKCTSALNLIRVLANTKWGADTKTLLKLHRSLIRSKLDYGCMVYMGASEEVLRPLDVIHNAGIRWSLGAFKSSPVESLYVEANELPLKERRQEFAMRYGLKIKSNPDNAANESLFRLRYRNDYLDEQGQLKYRVRESLGMCLDRLFNEANIETSDIMTTKIPDYPAWKSLPVDVSFVLSEFDKSTTSSEVFKSKFFEILPNYNNCFHIYTDGSKDGDKAAYGMYYSHETLAGRVLDKFSNFTAELEGIKAACRFIELSEIRHFVIFCDSKSVLESIQNQKSKNTLIVSVLDKIQNLLLTGKSIKFCWIPSHVGIYGNEQADQAAKGALQNSEIVTRRLPYTDLIPDVKKFIKDKWQERWNEKDTKLKEILPEIQPFPTNGLSRKEEVVIHRIRIGHTRLTHSYLMERGRQPVPMCLCCDEDLISVKHIMIECTNLRYVRRNHYVANDMKYLFEKIPLQNIIGFLKEARLFNLI